MRATYLGAAVALATAALFSSVAECRVAIERQDRDDDCGAEAVVTLMKMAGITISAGRLLETLKKKADSSAPGLTAADLRLMVERSGYPVELVGEWVSASELPSSVSSSPGIVLLYEAHEQRGQQARVLGHYVVVEAWSASRGFLVADPALGRRAFVATQELNKIAHGRESKGESKVLILRLRRAGKVVGLSQPVTSLEEGKLPKLIDLRRLPSGLPKGKTIVTVGVAHARSNISLDDESLGIGATSTSGAVTIQRGMGNGTALTLSVGGVASSAILHFPGNERFSLGRQSSLGRLYIGYTLPVELAQTATLSSSLTGGISFRSSGKPTGINAGMATHLQAGGTTLTGTLDVSVTHLSTSWDLAIAPSVAASRAVGKRVQVGAAILMHLPLTTGRPGAEAALFADVALSRNWSFGAYAAHGVFEPKGIRSRHIGLSITYAVPRRLRGSK